MTVVPSYTLYSVRGWGSAITESMLALCGASVELIDVAGCEQPGPARERLLAANRLAQVPTVILPSGEVMTESAAITLLLSERYPEARLAPPLGDALRPAFLRRLVWLVANVYPSWTYGDFPERWVTAAPAELTHSTDAFRMNLWTQLEAELPDGPWVLGQAFSALDIYVAVMSQWRPRISWFADHCPKLHAIAERTFDRPVVSPVLVCNFGSWAERK